MTLHAWRCPICNKRCRSERGVLVHMVDIHKKPQHAERIAEWEVKLSRQD